MNNDKVTSDLMVEAYTHQKQGDLSLAIKSWNTLINYVSDNQEIIANAHLNLGHLHLRQGNSDLAYESMAKAIAAIPNSPEAFYCLAYVEQEKENFHEAIELFESALKLKPKDVGAINNLANCYDRINKSRDSIKAYSRAISIDPEYITAYYNRGSIYNRLGKSQLAKKDLNKAKKLAKEEIEKSKN